MKSIIILGGGAAGWMTAKYLSVKNHNLNITVIESPNIPTVGVGESVTPYLMKFFKDIGIEDESEWMPKCNATLKNGVLYQDWDYIGSRMWHSFETDNEIYPYWNTKRVEDGLDRQDYWSSSMLSGGIAMRDSSKWFADKDGNIPEYTSDEMGWPQQYGYHMDAGLFGEYIKSITEVNHIVVDIVEMPTDDNGIVKLVDDDGREFTADLFVDCTGFKKSLISKVNPDFQTLAPYLTHDKAVVIPYPYLDKETEMKPRTKSTALSSGWCWEIPLDNRIGAGYVYTSKYISDKDAEKEFRNHIGFERVEGIKSFIVDIKTGYYKESFKKNVVAIGLSAGFIEPLESTLLFAVQVAGIRLDMLINDNMSVDDYNKQTTSNLEDYLDFISVNYYLSHREDSAFWKSQKNAHITNKMHKWVDNLKDKLQAPDKRELFVDSSWVSKAIGFNNFPNTHDNIYSEEANTKIAEFREIDHNNLMSQKEYLDKYIYKV